MRTTIHTQTHIHTNSHIYDLLSWIKIKHLICQTNSQNPMFCPHRLWPHAYISIHWTLVDWCTTTRSHPDPVWYVTSSMDRIQSKTILCFEQSNDLTWMPLLCWNKRTDCTAKDVCVIRKRSVEPCLFILFWFSIIFLFFFFVYSANYILMVWINSFCNSLSVQRGPMALQQCLLR